jgi:hypothetical protein
MDNLKALQEHFEKLKAHIIHEESKVVKRETVRTAKDRAKKAKIAKKNSYIPESSLTRKLTYIESSQQWEWK